MFKWLKSFVANANDTMNSEKAKALRKKLITIGAIGVGIGALFIVIGIILLITGAASNMNPSFERSFNFTNIIIGFVFFVLGGFSLTFSVPVLGAGLHIMIGGVATNILDVDENKDNRCPKCNDPIAPDETFCTKCGYNLRGNKVCKDCGTQNEFNDAYCKNCGKKLD